MSALAPALRIARRGVKRNLGRSILIAALIAIPVAGATLVDVLARTLSAPERQAERTLGAADARVSVTRVVGAGEGLASRGRGRARRQGQAGSREGRPHGAAAARDAHRARRELRRRGHARRGASASCDAYAVDVDPREPLLRHEDHVVEGRSPVRADEVLLSPALAERLHVRIGMTITRARRRR